MAAEKAHVDFGLYGLLGEDTIEHVPDLVAGGVIGFKLYMGNTFGKIPSPSTGAMLEAFEVVAPTGKRISLHAETNSHHGAARDAAAAAGRTDPLAHIASRPAVVAVEAVSRAAILAEWTGARIHILHISSAEELRPLREAKARGVDITGETCPHYLHAVGRRLRRVLPASSRQPAGARGAQPGAAVAALADGTIELIATDHAPHTPEEKTRNDIWTVDCGFPGVETQMPLMLTKMNAGRYTVCDYVRWSAANPAKIFGLYPRKGVIQPGSEADIAVVDLRANGRSTTPSCSRAPRSALPPLKVKGLPIHTLVRGRFVMKDRALAADTRGWGRSVHTIQQHAAARRAQCRSDAAGGHTPSRRPPAPAERLMMLTPTPESRRLTRRFARRAFVKLEKRDPHLRPRRTIGSRRSARPTSASTRAISSRWSGPRAAASRPSSSWSPACCSASSGYVYRRRPRGRRRAGARRHGVPESDAAAVAQAARQRHAAAQDRAAVPAGIPRQAQDASLRDRIEALLAQVGLEGFSDKYPWQLSGGMLQRASLCRALVHEPQLLMLDEPFGALDQFTREELWAIMQELWMTHRPTVLLVTHDLKEAGYLANRICVMQARPGHIIDDERRDVSPAPHDRHVLRAGICRH